MTALTKAYIDAVKLVIPEK